MDPSLTAGTLAGIAAIIASVGGLIGTIGGLYLAIKRANSHEDELMQLLKERQNDETKHKNYNGGIAPRSRRGRSIDRDIASVSRELDRDARKQANTVSQRELEQPESD